MNDNYNSDRNKPSSGLTPEQQWKQMQLQFQEQQKQHERNIKAQEEERAKRQEHLQRQRDFQVDRQLPTQQRRQSPEPQRRQVPDSQRRQVPDSQRRQAPEPQRQSSRSNSRIPKRRRNEYYKALFFRFLFLILIPLLLISAIVGLCIRLFGNHEEEVEDVDATTVVTEELVEEEDNTISFLAVGDNLIHERIFTYADECSGELDDGLYDFTSCYAYMADDIAEADISFVNQESIIGGDELGLYGYPAFNSPEQVAEDLVNLGFDMVNGATNHSMDMGITGVENTAEIWRQYEDDVLFSGIYDSQEDADTIRVMEQDGVTFALLSYTYGVNDYTMPNDYCVSLFDEDKIREDVANAKEIADVVIVSAHWGTESEYEVTDEQREYAQLFADLEVDLVIGHHPHVIQSLEWVEGENENQTLVAYSLGNFFSTMETVDTQLEGMLTLDFVVGDDDEITIENVAWTPLVNHFDEEVFFMLPLSEYTEELNSEHYVLADECPDAITTFTEMTKDIIGDEFTINF